MQRVPQGDVPVMGPPLQGRRSTVRRLTAAQEDKATSHTPRRPDSRPGRPVPTAGLEPATRDQSSDGWPYFSPPGVGKGLDTPVSRSLHAAAKHDTWV